MQFETYFGPVAVGRDRKRKTTTHKGYRCSSEQCDLHRASLSVGTNFCSKCGHAIEEFENKIETSYSYYELLYERGMNESLFQLDGTDFFGPNVRIFDRITSFTSSPESINMEDIDVEAEKEIFSETFADHIEVLKSMYGSVSVQWRIACYWS